jgi:hypothetical protein
MIIYLAFLGLLVTWITLSCEQTVRKNLGLTYSNGVHNDVDLLVIINYIPWVCKY